MTSLGNWTARILALVFIAGAVAACNTMEGAGKDIEKAGEAVQDASK